MKKKVKKWSALSSQLNSKDSQKERASHHCYFLRLYYLLFFKLKHSLCTMTSLVAQTVKHLPTMWETWVQSLGWEDLLEKEMATHSSTLAWKIPWTEGPGGLWARKELAMTEQLHFYIQCSPNLCCMAKWLSYTHIDILFFFFYSFPL